MGTLQSIMAFTKHEKKNYNIPTLLEKTAFNTKTQSKLMYILYLLDCSWMPTSGSLQSLQLGSQWAICSSPHNHEYQLDAGEVTAQPTDLAVLSWAPTLLFLLLLFSDRLQWSTRDAMPGTANITPRVWCLRDDKNDIWEKSQAVSTLVEDPKLIKPTSKSTLLPYFSCYERSSKTDHQSAHCASRHSC